MKGKTWFLLLGSLCGLASLPATGRAGDLPPCEPGYRIVEETCYREVVHKYCRLVPDVKKVTKPVYSCKSIDFCQKKCPGRDGCHDCCGEGSCARCGRVRTRKVLLKKFVTVEEPITRCEVQCVVERVPYTIYRKVPCAPAHPPTCPKPARAVPDGK